MADLKRASTVVHIQTCNMVSAVRNVMSCAGASAPGSEAALPGRSAPPVYLDHWQAARLCSTALSSTRASSSAPEVVVGIPC